MSDQTFDVGPPQRKPRKDHVNSGRPNGVKRFTKREREDAIRTVSRLLKPYVQPSDVVRYIIETWGISTRCAWDLLRDARGYLCARWRMDKGYLRCELVDFLSTLTGDRSASVSEKISAVNAIIRTLGLAAPDRSVVTNVEADAETAKGVLQAMHKQLLDDPELAEMSHQLYERLGGMGKAPLKDRVEIWHKQGEALKAEMDQADLAAGRLQNGIKERVADGEEAPTDL
jgi:hypothetical protein